MTEQNNNYFNNNQYIANEYEKQHQDATPDVQVEWISKFLFECPEAASNVHKYLQKNYSNQQKQVIQQNNSTPKRGHPLDDSGGSINNGNGRRKHPRRGFQQSTQNCIMVNHQHTSPAQADAQQDLNQSLNQRKRLSFEQLKYAVSSNLPCFHIQFASDADRNMVPSALHASDLILKELITNGVVISRFTLVGWVGKKLKLGVNNKEDYAALVSTDKWPTKINGIDIVVMKPKFNPDSFALVVRHVPRELEEEFVANEIQRTIASAERTKRIQYAYQRKTDDYRCDVKDYQEYNSVLQLGRIAIGHSWLSITPCFPGNRLTYCTKCWRIGHLRNKCNEEAKCRVCLEILTDNHSGICKNEPKCAQCDGKHHSLDNQCQTIREHKNRLKEEVDDAIKSGKLHRFAPTAHARQFELQEQDFPALKTTDNYSRTKWNIPQGHTTNQTVTTNSLETEKSLENINNKLSKLLDSNERVEKKVDKLTAELKIVTLDTQLHQAVLTDIIEIMKDFLDQFLPASLTYSKYERSSLIPLAQQFYNRFYSASTRLNDGIQMNRKVFFTPLNVNRQIAVPDKCSPVLYVSTAESTTTAKMVKSSNNQNIK